MKKRSPKKRWRNGWFHPGPVQVLVDENDFPIMKDDCFQIRITEPGNPILLPTRGMRLVIYPDKPYSFNFKIEYTIVGDDE